jgi:crotonobetainyl-CoA:carnitine CoA-transferase CaiB-like acyl-CoA transferase
MEPSRLHEILRAGGLELPSNAAVEVAGADPVLASRFPVGEAAAAALAMCGAAAADLWALRTGRRQRVRITVRGAAASLLSFAYQRLDGSPTPRRNAGSVVTALHQCRDGRWVHLHGGFPHLREGTLRVLGCDADDDRVAAAVRGWDAQALEDALAERGMCGAMARTSEEWQAHPQGRALSGLPAVEVIRLADAEPEPPPHGERPLGGVRVLDLTRVLAGPACGRTLAEHGADVLRISSPNLPSIPPFVIDTGHGKLSAHLDLNVRTDAAKLRALAREADVFCQSYRSGALDRRGFGPGDLAALRPGIVYVSINCYGHEGPWRERPGWEQLAQTVTGLATAQGSPDRPQLLGSAACDYTTGYLAACGAMLALARRAKEGGSWLVRASLCQTGMWFERLGPTCDPGAAAGVGNPSDLLTESDTPHGRLSHLAPAVEMSETPPRWERPTVPLGAHPPEWPGR